MKTIPKQFGNFIKLAANNWRVNNKREITVKEIIGFMSDSAQSRNQNYFAHFAFCPEFEKILKP